MFRWTIFTDPLSDYFEVFEFLIKSRRRLSYHLLQTYLPRWACWTIKSAEYYVKTARVKSDFRLVVYSNQVKIKISRWDKRISSGWSSLFYCFYVVDLVLQNWGQQHGNGPYYLIGERRILTIAFYFKISFGVASWPSWNIGTIWRRLIANFKFQMVRFLRRVYCKFLKKFSRFLFGKILAMRVPDLI